MKTQLFKNHLRDKGRITLAEAAAIGVYYPGKVVSELRKQYGADSIVTSHRKRLTKYGYVNELQYCLTTIGRAKMFPVKKTFPQWITAHL